MLFVGIALSGLLFVFGLALMVRENTKRWRRELKPPQAVEPECFMPLLKHRERIAYRGHSAVTICVASDDPAEAVKVLEKVR